MKIHWALAIFSAVLFGILEIIAFYFLIMPIKILFVPDLIADNARFLIIPFLVVFSSYIYFKNSEKNFLSGIILGICFLLIKFVKQLSLFIIYLMYWRPDLSQHDSIYSIDDFFYDLKRWTDFGNHPQIYIFIAEIMLFTVLTPLILKKLSKSKNNNNKNEEQ